MEKEIMLSVCTSMLLAHHYDRWSAMRQQFRDAEEKGERSKTKQGTGGYKSEQGYRRVI